MSRVAKLGPRLPGDQVSSPSNTYLVPRLIDRSLDAAIGVIILGMHRSGTSVLGGLINKMGLKTGGPLIQAAEDNAKGFFERIDVVLQNDNVMKNQRIHYSFHTYKYNALKGLTDILNDMEEGPFFSEGRRGLKFLNDEASFPWMLKDPRLCITFRTWLPLLKFIPSILFTYRHPMDVALSMHKRDFEQFEMSKGLKLWYVYNRMAVEQSHDLCRVVTSHRLIMQQPEVELNRIYDELRGCGVEVPRRVSKEDINDFIDLRLQHGRTTLKDTSCEEDLDGIMPPSSWENPSTSDVDLYRQCIRAYCAMEDRSAFSANFEWNHSIIDD
jgi:hypothetical protein